MTETTHQADKQSSQDGTPTPRGRAGERPQGNYIFETRMEVRDYECDIEGIVNNANYLHYTEHTRHRFLRHAGLSFARMHEKGVDAVVARMNLAFKTPLRCDDEFISRLALKKEGVRYVFTHDLFRASDEKLSFHAVVELVCLVNGRLAVSEDYDRAFEPFLQPK